MVEQFVPITNPSAPPTTRIGANLTEEQQSTYSRVESHFASTDFQVASDPPSILSVDEKFWLTKECLLRYLRATKWHEESAIERIHATLRWRRDYGLTTFITAEYVEPEAVTGKQVIFGYDTDCHPALYLLPSRQNTDEPTRQLQYTVWVLERCIDLMDANVEALDLLIDFGDRGKNPSLGTARQMLNILRRFYHFSAILILKRYSIEEHYPERLGKALIINVPFIVNAFFKLIMPFVDPLTRAKIRFNPIVVKEGIFAPDMVSQAWGGDVNFIYEHSKYWPQLLNITQSRRAANLAQWKMRGGTVGLSEFDIKDIDLRVGIDRGDKKGVSVVIRLRGYL